jgi:hypothetical protein
MGIIKYLAVPNSLASCCEYWISPVTAEVASSSLVVPAILLGDFVPAFRVELVDSFKGAHN